MTDVARRRAVAAGVAALVVAGLVVLVLAVTGGGGGGGSALPSDSARLVPPDALVYLHVSTDGDRAATKRALAVAQRFPSWPRLRDRAAGALFFNETDPSAAQRWLGDEIALALLGTSGQAGTAGSLLVMDSRDDKAAEDYLNSRVQGGKSTYRGVTLRTIGNGVAALAGGHVLYGQPVTVKEAIDLAQGRVKKSLANDPGFVRARKGLPADRVADAYATGAGLRRIVAPAGGVLGVAGTLLDRPGLQSIAVSLAAGSPGARLRVHEISQPVAGQAAPQPFQAGLAGDVPKDAMAAIDTRGIDQVATRLLGAAGAGGLGSLTGVLEKALGSTGSADVRKGLLPILRGEVAVVLLKGVPAPTLVLIAKTGDEDATRQALDRLEPALTKLLKGGAIQHRRIAGQDVTAVRSGSRDLALAAVVDGKLILSTTAAGITAAADPKGGLDSADAFKATVVDPGKPLTSLVFLDFSQLLELGEQTGLNQSPAYLAVQDDLAKVRAVGARSTGTRGDSTAEIRLQIP